VDLKLKSGKMGVELLCDDEFILKMIDKFSDMNGIGTLLTQMPDILSNVMRMMMTQQMNKIMREQPQQAVVMPTGVGFGGQTFTQGPPDEITRRMQEAMLNAMNKNKKKGKSKAKQKSGPTPTTMTGDYDVDVTLVNPDPAIDASQSPS
jgi:hypothetical protein